jgi:hypothetical protein
MKTVTQVVIGFIAIILSAVGHAEEPYFVCNLNPLKVSIYMPNGFYGGGIYSVVNQFGTDSEQIPTDWRAEGTGNCGVLYLSFSHRDTDFDIGSSLGCSPGSVIIPENATGTISINNFHAYCRNK